MTMTPPRTLAGERFWFRALDVEMVFLKTGTMLTRPYLARLQPARLDGLDYLEHPRVQDHSRPQLPIVKDDRILVRKSMATRTTETKPADGLEKGTNG